MVIRALKSFLMVVVVAASLPAGISAALSAEEPEKFYGSYVGSGTAQRVADNITEQRDLDVTVEEFKNGGFTVKWITVVRGPDGGRTGAAHRNDPGR